MQPGGEVVATASGLLAENDEGISTDELMAALRRSACAAFWPTSTAWARSPTTPR